jgi:methylated-DNA-[protein]-cysteine S-methyltransferase
MTAPAFTIFDSPIGAIGLIWTAHGIAGLSLPEQSAAGTRSRLKRRWPEARETPPPPGVQKVIARVLELLGGAAVDLSDVPIDLARAEDFHRRVYEVARTIPPGQTMTYGEIARRLGAPQESREVGQALGRNPIAIIVPCHRVLGADGKMGGFSAPGGIATKRRILEIEGAAALGAGPLFEARPRHG